LYTILYSTFCDILFALFKSLTVYTLCYWFYTSFRLYATVLFFIFFSLDYC